MAIQSRTKIFIECDFESERDLNWYPSAVIHTLEQGTPPLSGGHWWKIINNAFVEIAPPGIVIDNKFFTQTANKAIVNTVAEASLFGIGVGSRDFPALILITGTNVFISIRGFGSRASGNVIINVKLNGTVIGTTGAMLVGTLNNDEFKIEFNFTVRSSGISGSVIGQGEFTNLNSGNILEMVNLATTTINTTIIQTLDVTWQWSVANIGNSVTSTNASINI